MHINKIKTIALFICLIALYVFAYIAYTVNIFPFKAGGFELIFSAIVWGSVFCGYILYVYWPINKIQNYKALEKINIVLSGLYIIFHALLVLYIITN